MAQDLGLKRLSEGKGTFSKGKVLVMLVESFGARVFSGACKKGSLKKFSARDFFCSNSIERKEDVC